MENESQFYKEWVEFHGDEEKEEAFQYLKLWKRFFLRKNPELEQIGHDQIVLRPDVFGPGRNTLGIKIETKVTKR